MDSDSWNYFLHESDVFRRDAFTAMFLPEDLCYELQAQEAQEGEGIIDLVH